MLYWWLLLSTTDATHYADDPSDQDARSGVLWFHNLAAWLRERGGRLSAGLASLVLG